MRNALKYNGVNLFNINNVQSLYCTFEKKQ